MKLLIFINFFAIVLCADVNQNPPPPWPVLKFKFEVNPNQANGLLGELIDSERYMNYKPTIPANQLVMNTNIHELSLAEWSQVLVQSKLNFTNINAEKLKEIIRTLHINTSVEYFRFNEMIDDPMNQMGQAMKAINVSDLSLLYYTVEHPVGDDKFIDLFKYANYSNWPEAQKHLKLNDEQIFDFFKKCILRYLGHITLYDFGRLVKNITGEVANFHVGYEKNQVGILKSLFDFLEVYPVQDFKVMIDNYNQTIVSPMMLATRVATGKYISSGAIYDEITRMSAKYTKPFLIEGPRGRYEIKVMNFNKSLVNFETNDNITWVNKSSNVVSQLQRCYYAPNENETLLVSATESSNQMHINKGTNVVFIKGAPLFCDQVLVGVALTESVSSIIFAKVPFTFMEPVKPGNHDIVTNGTKPTPPQPPVTLSTHVIASVNFRIIESKIPNLVAYLLMDSVTGNSSETNTDGVTPTDIIQTFELDQISYADFLQLVSNKRPSSDDIKDTLDLLKKFNVSPLQIYHHLMSILNDAQKENMFKAVNISSLELQRLLLYHPQNETKFKEFILTGNFSKTNVENALKAVNLTRNSIFDIAKPFVLQSAYNSNLGNVLELVKSLGGYPTLSKLLTKYHVGPDTIRTYKGYEKILNNFAKLLGNSSAQAPIISRRHVLTSNDVYDSYNDPTTREFVFLEVSTAQTSSDVFSIVPYTTGYANITLDNLLPVNQPALTTATDTDPKDCKMITVEGIYDAHKVEHSKHEFEVRIDAMITKDAYRVGAGLVCSGRLYGVATKMAEDKIHFAGFKNGVPPSDNVKPPAAAAHITSYNVIVLASCAILSLIRFM